MEKLISIQEGVIARQIPDEIILININNNKDSKIIDLKDSALNIWELIESGITNIDTIINEMSKKYDVDKSVLKNDIMSFLKDLETNNIIKFIK